jgi:hypothetical protein
MSGLTATHMSRMQPARNPLAPIKYLPKQNSETRPKISFDDIIYSDGQTRLSSVKTSFRSRVRQDRGEVEGKTGLHGGSP